MRKLMTIASAVALAVSMPALAKDKGQGGGGKGGGGGPPAHAQKADKGHGGGHGGGGWKADKPQKMDRGFARQEIKADKAFRKNEAKAERNWAKAEAKAEKGWRKAEQKAQKQWAKQDKQFAKEERRAREARFDDRRRFDDGGQRLAGMSGACPPGLAKKGNGCLPPGQAQKLYRVGEALPAAYYPAYNLPDEYRDWYYDTPDYSYRYDDGYIYRVDSGTNLVSALIPLLGGGFGIGNLLPAGYDVYNVPYAYRDDYYDSGDSLYRYGDEAIYRVDPQSQMIEGIVALLAGDLNVGQILPTGYDTYNLPMQYRDQYVDSGDAWYRYADGNIYEVDPQTRMIEQIVAMLV